MDERAGRSRGCHGERCTMIAMTLSIAESVSRFVHPG